MTLLLAMLPLYLFGNLHCLGMCGPLVMMIGQHRYRNFYFFGRLCSFALAGLIAGEIGAVAGAFFKQYYLGETLSIFIGSFLLILGLYTLMGKSSPGSEWLGRRLSKASQTLSLLILQDRAWPTFLFGFFTIALPCGQTLIVFSACALSGEAYVGFINGIAFALLTSPSLFFAMRAHHLLKYAQQFHRPVIGLSAVLVGLGAIFRGIAEIGWISHFTIQPFSSEIYHLSIF